MKGRGSHNYLDLKVLHFGDQRNHQGILEFFICLSLLSYVFLNDLCICHFKLLLLGSICLCSSCVSLQIVQSFALIEARFVSCDARMNAVYFSGDSRAEIFQCGGCYHSSCDCLLWTTLSACACVHNVQVSSASYYFSFNHCYEILLDDVGLCTENIQ